MQFRISNRDRFMNVERKESLVSSSLGGLMSLCTLSKNAKLTFALPRLWHAQITVQFTGAFQKRVIIHGTDTKIFDSCLMTSNPSTDFTYTFANHRTADEHGITDQLCDIEVLFADAACGAAGEFTPATAGSEILSQTSEATYTSKWRFNSSGKNSVQITVVIVDNAGGGSHLPGKLDGARIPVPATAKAPPRK